MIITLIEKNLKLENMQKQVQSVMGGFLLLIELIQ